MDRSERLESAKRLISEGDEQFRRGNTSSALDRYREGLSLLELDAGTVELLISTLNERERYERRIDQLERELNEYKSMKSAFAARIEELKDEAARISVSEADSLGADLSDHLETKLTIKQLLDSAPVREEYPSLYEDAEEFFIALEEEQFEAGKAAAVTDLISLIEAIEEGDDYDPAVASIWDKYDSPKQREELLQFVTALTAIYN
jgi:vacuolar-type H+-ATPase subunit I/STV1